MSNNESSTYVLGASVTLEDPFQSGSGRAVEMGVTGSDAREGMTTHNKEKEQGNSPLQIWWEMGVCAQAMTSMKPQYIHANYNIKHHLRYVFRVTCFPWTKTLCWDLAGS